MRLGLGWIMRCLASRPWSIRRGKSRGIGVHAGLKRVAELTKQTNRRALCEELPRVHAWELQESEQHLEGERCGKDQGDGWGSGREVCCEASALHVKGTRFEKHSPRQRFPGKPSHGAQLAYTGVLSLSEPWYRYCEK